MQYVKQANACKKALRLQSMKQDKACNGIALAIHEAGQLMKQDNLWGGIELARHEAGQLVQGVVLAIQEAGQLMRGCTAFAIHVETTNTNSCTQASRLQDIKQIKSGKAHRTCKT